MPLIPAATLAWGSLAASAIGTGVAVYGAAQQAQTAKSTAEYNAELQTQQAATEDAQNRENLARLRGQNDRALADQRAGYAASGVSIDSGTPLEVQAQTAAILKLNLLDQNRASLTRQSNLLAGAEAARRYGAAESSAAYLQGAGSLLSGLGSMAGNAYKFNRDGVFAPPSSANIGSMNSTYSGPINLWSSAG